MSHYQPSIAEMRRAATPHDWVDDFPFWGGYVLHTCGSCLSTFHSFAGREFCHACQPGAIESKEAPCLES